MHSDGEKTTIASRTNGLHKPTHTHKYARKPTLAVLIFAFTNPVPAPPAAAALNLQRRLVHLPFPPPLSSHTPSDRFVQFFVVAVTVAGAYFGMDANIRSELNSIVGPTIMTAVLAYYTGKMITGVYGMAITTILQCFVADEELFPPSQQFADNDLKSWVDKHGAPMEVDSRPQSRNGANQYAFS